MSRDFDWCSADNADVILPEQRALAIYENPRGQIVLRQEREWCDDQDSFVIISCSNLRHVAERLLELAAEAEAEDGKWYDVERPDPMPEPGDTYENTVRSSPPRDEDKGGPKDPTAAERQRRRRERLKSEAGD